MGRVLFFLRCTGIAVSGILIGDMQSFFVSSCFSVTRDTGYICLVDNCLPSVYEYTI